MLAQISGRQFEEWRAYADLEPFDEERADYRAGHIVQTLRNINRGKGKAPVSLKDCVISFGKKPEPVAQNPEQARASVRRTMGLLMAMQDKKRHVKRAGRQG